MTNNIAKSTLYGVLASAILLGVYFVVLTLVSGWGYAQSQFADFWYYIISLVVGFGIQIALYQYLRGLVRSGQGMLPAQAGNVAGVSGVTSTVSMISCCAHYAVSVLPILGITGIATFVAQYQVDIFWAGLTMNVFGIIFIGSNIITFKQLHA
ncbi:MAG: hypothetical protein AAB343_03365 [Patescibacteria group bacterium]